jgi:GTPase SAR1 family protein
MKVALVGLPQSGKTSLFTALTGTEPGHEKSGIAIGTVKVPDARVDTLFMCIVRSSGRVQARNCGAPASPSHLAAGLIRLLLSNSVADYSDMEYCQAHRTKPGLSSSLHSQRFRRS